MTTNGANPGPAIVAATTTARHRVRAHFMALHALSPDDAIEYAPERALEHKQFNRMRAAGVIRDAAPGHYWLDLDRMDREDDRRRRKRVPLAIGGAVIIALLAMLFYRG